MRVADNDDDRAVAHDDRSAADAEPRVAYDAFDLDDPDAMFKEWNNIFRSMALSPAMAAPAVLLNMVKPVMGFYENAKTED